MILLCHERVPIYQYHQPARIVLAVQFLWGILVCLPANILGETQLAMLMRQLHMQGLFLRMMKQSFSRRPKEAVQMFLYSVQVHFIYLFHLICENESMRLPLQEIREGKSPFSIYTIRPDKEAQLSS